MTDSATERRRTRRGESRPSLPDNCLVGGADPERVARGQELLLDEDHYFRLAETFRALADSSRIKIVYSLLDQELCTCDLAAITGQSESTVSQHLRVLRQLRLVKNRRDGKLVFYSLDDAHIGILLAVCLSHIQDDHSNVADLERLTTMVLSKQHNV